jgi:hypothetical protein
VLPPKFSLNHGTTAFVGSQTQGNGAKIVPYVHQAVTLAMWDQKA